MNSKTLVGHQHAGRAVATYLPPLLAFGWSVDSPKHPPGYDNRAAFEFLRLLHGRFYLLRAKC